MIFISILFLIVAIALPSFNKEFTSIFFTRISSIIFLYSAALSFNALYIQSIGSGIGLYCGLFHITVISQFFEIFFLCIASFILVSWPLNHQYYLKQMTHLKLRIQEKTNYATEYALIALFSTLGACMLISSADLISMYLSIELQSFGVYILATLFRDSESATSAGLKYFLLGALSSCLILLGTGLIYSYTGLTQFESIYNLISVYNNTQVIQGFSLGMIIIFIGFLFKIAAAPLHHWAPDVYDDSPTIVTIWLTIMPKISILILLLELYTQIGWMEGFTHSISDIFYTDVFNNIIYNLKWLLLISSLLSLIIGTIVGLAQTKIKRLLAYSTISHIGFILLALAINTEQSIDSFIFYIIQYTITNLNIFLILIALGYVIKNTLSYPSQINKEDIVKDINYISELKSQFFLNPILSVSLTVCLFSMAGIPPLIGFFSKQFVLYSAIGNGYYFMTIIAILVSVISASYYLKIVKVLHSETEDNNTLSTSLPSTSFISNVHSYFISTFTLIILLFVLKPSIILNSTQLLSLTLFQF